MLYVCIIIPDKKATLDLKKWRVQSLLRVRIEKKTIVTHPLLVIQSAVV